MWVQDFEPLRQVECRFESIMFAAIQLPGNVFRSATIHHHRRVATPILKSNAEASDSVVHFR